MYRHITIAFLTRSNCKTMYNFIKKLCYDTCHMNFKLTAVYIKFEHKINLHCNTVFLSAYYPTLYPQFAKQSVFGLICFFKFHCRSNKSELKAVTAF